MSISESHRLQPLEDEKTLGTLHPVTTNSQVDYSPAPALKAAAPPPPNGGFRAWLQVVGAFFLFFNSWGVINSFGVFQSYLQTSLLQSYSPSIVSWVGTTQGCLLLLVCVITGPLFDKGYLHVLIFVGTFLVVFGLMMTSLATEYYQFFLAQGLCIGVGSSFLFIPSVAVVATYFTTKRALAIGITAAGGSVGGVIYPVVFRELVPTIGFGWATRVIGFLVLATLIPPMVFMRGRLPPPAKARALVDLTAFRESSFNVFVLGLFFLFVGLYFPFFYLPSFAESRLGVDEDTSFYLLSILNAASVFGRIFPGLMADKIGSINTVIPCAFISIVLAFSWLAIHNLAGAVIFACFYGFFSGAIVSLPPTISATLTKDISIVGTRMGMCFCFSALGLLIGNPIAGALLDLQNGVFWKGQVFSACLLLGGGISFVALRVVVKRLGFGRKV